MYNKPDIVKVLGWAGHVIRMDANKVLLNVSQYSSDFILIVDHVSYSKPLISCLYGQDMVWV